jgi:hypothetical protein
MAEKFLTDSEVLEIVYGSEESLSDSSDSVSSSDNDTDDIAVVDAIINDNTNEEEEILHRDFRWETMDNTQDREKCSVVILDPEMVQKM